ncbi:MAG: hypothetical protein M1817_003369 [Caeruleum heppii]|nr:MAG: hypothetical protein M1817_003369 [Caeruleum heppii]
MSSAASSGYQYPGAGHKRGISEATGMVSPVRPARYGTPAESSPEGTYKNMRQSLRPLPQPPNPSPPASRPTPPSHTRNHSHGVDSPATRNPPYQSDHTPTKPLNATSRLNGGLGRSDSRAMSSVRSSVRDPTYSPSTSGHMVTPDLDTLQKSSTSHLRTLSKMTECGSAEDFGISPFAPEVVGMHGRRRLQRAGSTRGAKGSQPSRGGVGGGWGERNWMDKQRQFLQAYEYLCHIGEAKEWIENIVHQTLPPIVQLEEALRDGVTLAEVVQAIHPNRPNRIFRHPKLQFRHSDNIALFFRFLAEVELPELFRFELIDLYEKKNIPKVIYCIHALSWLLYRNGIIDFRIGNLVGQLEFEHHELEEMQKGLDKAGVSMPSFSGMGANFGAEPEPEPEPVETEEERVVRELSEHEQLVLELQAQVRGAIVRLRLGNEMQQLWDSENMLVQLQSRIRGDWARQIAEYRLNMRRFAVDLQSASRGYLVRGRQQGEQQFWQDREPQVVAIQSLIRAKKAREGVEYLTARLGQQESGVRGFQAAIRGALKRRQVDAQCQETHDASTTIEQLQAAVKGSLARSRIIEDRQRLEQQLRSISKLQGFVRGYNLRQQQAAVTTTLRRNETLWRALQAVARGQIVRKAQASARTLLLQRSSEIVRLQGAVRGQTLRRRVADDRSVLLGQTAHIVHMQAAARGRCLRKRVAADHAALQARTGVIIQLQGLARGCLLREGNNRLLENLQSHTPAITVLQGLSRAMLLRNEVGALLSDLEAEEDMVVELQAAVRAMLVRAKYAEKKRFFKENMEKVVKIQSFVRGRQQGEAYKSLTCGTNPPVGTLKGFVHLLNDSDFDFDEEIEFERLRKTVVQHVRQNEMAEQYIDQLDIKIALLVKNKITLDEVVKHQKHFGGHVGSLLTNSDMASKDPFDLKALNKNSRRKLEHYQELFFILQTQPQYLARLFKRVREQGTAEKDSKRMENLMMGLFGYAQKRREEYYLLKLIVRSVREEIESCNAVQDYLRGHFFWSKLLNGYIRSPRDRKFMRDLLGPLVRENIIDHQELDLESDPVQIYRSAINNEELRTGQRSHGRLDISREEAIKDPETRKTFTTHLQDLRDIVDQFIAALEEFHTRMPYGMRYVAQQMFQSLRDGFPHENPQDLLQMVGHWLWKSYLQPALTQPEAWGVVDRALTPLQKRNLGEVAKVLSQIAIGRLFGGDNVFLQPLNKYVADSIGNLCQIWENVISVKDAEAQFDIDEFNDLYARTKPTLYIKMSDIFAIHQLIAADISTICPSRDDILREVVHELGSAKSNESEMVGVSSKEINLTLNPKLHDVEDPDAAVNALFMETKRCILYIIRVQSGPNLMEILVKPITMEDEERWQTLLDEEFSADSHKRAAYSDANALVDITTLTYAELKRTALENIVGLERAGRVTRHNHYQDLLNAIAVDIRTKHRRRVQRQRELEGVRLTLGNLNEKASWLDSQLQSYNNYIEQAMVTLQNKKGKKRFLLPFTRQYNHERELARSGRTPKFGSFKYSARALFDKGVLVDYVGFSDRQLAQINLTISSDAVGMFFVEASQGSIVIPGASASVPLDDLLQAQFNNLGSLVLWGDGAGGSGGGGGGNGGGGGALKVNVNLFLHLVFRKFYRDD